AKKPNIDRIAKLGEMGMVTTVPEGFPPGSDVANLAVFGYDPQKYYTGRSPLEAVSIGVPIELTDTTFRTNVVTLSDETNFADKTMIDYSSDEITTAESHQLIDSVNKALKTDEYEFFGGISYRHLLVWHNKENDFSLTPPHDISGRIVGEYLPKDTTLRTLMEKSYDILKDHPVNIERIKRGLHPANSIWIWGNGTRPNLDTYEKRFGINGAVVSAVDLVKGIGFCAGLNVIDVEGATGNVHTNFDGKAEAAIKAFEDGAEFVYVHLEAPDEAGHRHEVDNKVKAIELIDEKIVAPIVKYLDSTGDEYRMLIMPDHPTPLEIMTHTSDPIPYVFYNNRTSNGAGTLGYTEKNAESTGNYTKNGYTLINKLFAK
ncbi:MAG: cofactor-independent phosphoglycerate mutase, partial [Oscillospiraceae bacterium]